MRCDAFRSKFSSAQRLFFSSFASTSSVTNSVFIKNKSRDPTYLFPPKQINHSNLRFPNIKSKALKDLSSVDFATYLFLEADNKTKVTGNAIFQQVNKRLPFFKGTEEFTTAVNELSNLSYIHRAEVFYVFAEYYLQLKQRSQALYQVELDSYGSILLDSSKDHKRSETYRKIRYNLTKGDRTRRIAAASNESSMYLLSDPVSNFIDSSHGLPVSAMEGGTLWYSDNGPNIPLNTTLQMTEILLNEPLFSDKDIIDTSVDLKQTLDIDGFDPLLLGTLEGLSADRHKHYVEDVRKKLHIALREVRKNVLLHKYTLKVDKFLSSRDAAKFDVEHVPVESKVSEILKTLFRPVVADIDQAVLSNLSKAHEFIFSDTAHLSSKMSELDALLSRSDSSGLSPLSHTVHHSSYVSNKSATPMGNVPVL